jgi:integrase
VKKMHVVLRKALSQVGYDGLIPRNAADGVKLPRVSAPGDEIKPLNSEESAAFLEAARGERRCLRVSPTLKISFPRILLL